MYRVVFWTKKAVVSLKQSKIITSGKQGMAVTNLMRYNVKPTGVRSENLLNNIKASNGNEFTGSSEGQIIFDVPAMSGGYYLDSAGSRFRFTLTLENATTTT